MFTYIPGTPFVKPSVLARTLLQQTARTRKRMLGFVCGLFLIPLGTELSQHAVPHAA